MLHLYSKAPPYCFTRLSHLLFMVLCFCLGVTGLGGCAAARWDTPTVISSSPTTNRVSNAQITLQQMLGSVFDEWQGTKYQYGGTSRNGIDCSAFTQRAINTVYGVQLPRTTLQQMTMGHSVDVEQIRAGDMVFFRTGPSLHHVGVMMDSVKFMHASTNHGVSLSRLDDRYWQSRLIAVRRID